MEYLIGVGLALGCVPSPCWPDLIATASSIRRCWPWLPPI